MSHVTYHTPAPLRSFFPFSPRTHLDPNPPWPFADIDKVDVGMFME